MADAANRSMTPISPALSPSLAEVHRTIHVPRGGRWLAKLLAFTGPGYMVSVGYMDPGNWATDLAGGAQFGYTLLSVILLSNVMAVILQALAARLEAAGVALDSQGRIKAGVESRYRYQTSQEKIFAGGDAVRGADLVVTAMAEGRHAAQGILDYLARKTTPLH